MKKNTVAICIPVRNAEEFIEGLILSLLKDHDLKKIIYVSDNNSTDKTPIILDSLKREHKEIKVHFQEKNIGEVKNFYFLLNWAQSEMEAEFFCWQSHDDIRVAKSLDKLANILNEKPNLIGVCSYTSRRDLSGKKLDPFMPDPLTQNSPVLRLVFEWRKPLVTKYYGLFRLDLLPKANDMYLGDYHDQIYLDRIIAKGQIDVIPEELFIYRENLKKRRTSNDQFLKKLSKKPIFFYRYNHFMYFYETFKLIFKIKINLIKKIFLFGRFFYYFFFNKLNRLEK